MMKKIPFLVVAGFVCVNPLSKAVAAVELAKVNSTVITQEDLEKRYKDNQRFLLPRNTGKKAFLEELIKRELAIQEAKKMNLDKDPEIIDRMNTVLFQAFVERKLAKELEKIQVSESDAKEFYKKNPEIRTSHIWVPISPDAPEAEQKKAMEKIKNIQDKYLKPGKMSFAEVAQRESSGPAAPMGGDIDYQTKDRLDPAYYAEALRLGSPGKVGGIIRTPFGFHIIKVTAIRPWEEADKGLARRLLIEEKKTQSYEKLMADLRKQAKVSVKSELIRD
ncbi:MAG: peptidylprolyl isomerase [Bdellovibrionales bacterium]|nr:peptidylprolyl isomerase [Bdellovibrionales bacterium]